MGAGGNGPYVPSLRTSVPSLGTRWGDDLSVMASLGTGRWGHGGMVTRAQQVGVEDGTS